MPPLGTGWFCYSAMNGTDRVATDLQGPFDTREDLVNWITASGLQYRPNGEAYKRAVLYFGEMTGDCSEGAWATAIHYRRPPNA